MPSRPLTVAVVYGTFPPEREGGADFLANFTPALGATGARVHVITSTGGGPPRERLADGVTVHRIVSDWTLSKGGRADLDDVNDLLREESVEVVHVIFPDSVRQATYQLPAAIGFPWIPLVPTFWNLGLGRRSPLPIKLEALALLGRSTVLTSHDPAYLQALRRIAAGLKPVRWLPIGSNIGTETRRPTSEVRREYGLDGAAALAYFGHLDFTRGIEDLFAALAALRQGGRAVRLVMLGGADTKRYREYERLAQRLRIDEAVVWTPYLERQPAADLLGSVDVCVLPYRRNHVGRSALAAALRLGVPTILGGTPERIAPLRGGEDVELVRPGAPMELGAAVARLLDDPERRERLAAGARRAGRLFEWPRVAAAARAIYLEAINRRFRTATGGSGRAGA